jgi:outer membrane protein OmpA-like peptidoglycan-associated protein
MYMKRPAFLLTIALFSLAARAQEVDTTRNLVINGGFEEVEHKRLKRQGGIAYAKGWSSPTEVKADVFSDQAPADSLTSAPRNYMGDQTAMSGSAYAGIRTWSYANKDPRSYIRTRLKTPLKKDTLYCVRFYVSLADLSKYATNELAVYLTNAVVDKKDAQSLTFTPHVPLDRTKIYADMFSWQGVCGVFQGQGFENNLIIGNFAASERTDNQKTKRPKGENRMQLPVAYYYVDNVEVYSIKDRSQCKCEQIKDAESEFIFSRKGAPNPTWKAAQRVDAQVFYFKRFQRLMDPSMDPFLNDLVNDLKADAALKVRLVGHTDATELERTRVRPVLAELGKERAEAVRDALVEAGIDAGRITVVGKAADDAADTTGTEIGMSKNRRVEVELQ